MPITQDIEARDQLRRQMGRLKGAWAQLWREIRTPVRRNGGLMLGATAQSYRDVLAQRTEWGRLVALWEPWMGEYPFDIGAEPYSKDRSLSTGQNEARVSWYQDLINDLMVAYNGLFRDWNLSFESLTHTEQTYYAQEIQYRVNNPELFTEWTIRLWTDPSDTAVHREGVTRTHGTSISSNIDIERAAMQKYAPGTGTDTEPETPGFIKFLPAVGIGLTAFKLFFSK